MKTVFVLVLAAAAVLLTGCGDYQDDPGLEADFDTVRTSAETTTVEQTETTAAAAASSAASASASDTDVSGTTTTTSATTTTVTTTTVTTVSYESYTANTLFTLTDQELTDMEEVDHAILVLKGKIDYMKMTPEKQAEKMDALLQQLAEAGTENAPYPLIEKDSILYDSYGMQFSFMYTCGVLGGVRIRPFDPQMN